MALLNRAKWASEARKGGSHKGREGGSVLKSARARKAFQSHFSRSLLWGSFRGVKTYSEKKRFMVKTFKIQMKYDQYLQGIYSMNDIMFMVGDFFL